MENLNMNDFVNAFWIELLKARRSRIPWLTAAGFMILPLAAGFLMFIYQNPDFARDIGLLAVPVWRGAILLAKFLVAALWSAALALLVYAVSLVLGTAMRLPLASPDLLIHSSVAIAVTSLLVMLTVTPVALFASLGRGYLLPLGLVVLLIAVGNIIALLGWGDYFPWSVPAMYADFNGKGASLAPISYWIVIGTGLVGMAATYLWWKNADQSR
jgi:ABC-2 type transport system permease protein